MNSPASIDAAPAPVQLTRHRLVEWLAKAQPGARICYGVGFFARKLVSEDVGDALRDAAALGLVYLVQGKVADGGRPYMVERSSRPIDKPLKPGDRR